MPPRSEREPVQRFNASKRSQPCCLLLAFFRHPGECAPEPVVVIRYGLLEMLKHPGRQIACRNVVGVGQSIKMADQAFGFRCALPDRCRDTQCCAWVINAAHHAMRLAFFMGPADSLRCRPGAIRSSPSTISRMIWVTRASARSAVRKVYSDQPLLGTSGSGWIRTARKAPIPPSVL